MRRAIIVVFGGLLGPVSRKVAVVAQIAVMGAYEVSVQLVLALFAIAFAWLALTAGSFWILFGLGFAVLALVLMYRAVTALAASVEAANELSKSGLRRIVVTMPPRTHRGGDATGPGQSGLEPR